MKHIYFSFLCYLIFLCYYISILPFLLYLSFQSVWINTIKSSHRKPGSKWYISRILKLAFSAYWKCDADLSKSKVRVVLNLKNRSSLPKVFLGKGILKLCSKLTGRILISIKLLCNFIEITLWHGCSPLKMLLLFSERLFLRTPLEGCLWKKKNCWENLLNFLFSTLLVLVFNSISAERGAKMPYPLNFFE